jgi:hypothetical protein
VSDNAYNIQTTSPAPAPLPAPTTPVPGKTMSIIALILPFLCCWPVGLILAIVGFVQGKGHPRGLSVAAIIVNCFFMLLSIVGMALSPSESDLKDFDTSSFAAPAPAAPSGPPTVTTKNAHSIADALEAEVDSDR